MYVQHVNYISFFFFFVAFQPLFRSWPILSQSFDITMGHTTLGRTPPERVISPTIRPLPDNTHQSQKRYIHALGVVPTHNPRKRATASQALDHETNAIGLSIYTHSIWRFETYSSYWSNIIQPKTVKRI